MKTIIAVILCMDLLILEACEETWGHTQKAIDDVTVSQPGILDTTESSCPYLTADSKGKLAVSWIRAVNDSQSVVCYAVSPDNGASFLKPVLIPGSENVNPHGENMPKIVFKPSGEIIAVWGATNPNPGNKYAGKVYYAQSFDNGESWTKAKALVNDPKGFDQRYFDLALLPGGEAAVIWLDNRRKGPRKGSALYFASTKGNTGFLNEHIISEPCCECCRTVLTVNGGSIHVAYRGIINDTIRDMVHAVSLDNGKSFSKPERLSKDNWVIAGCPHTGPALAVNKEGLQVAWYTMGSGSGVYYAHSGDNGKSFSARDSVSSKPSARHPQLTCMPGGDIVIAWEEVIGKDRPGTGIMLQVRSASGEKRLRQNITPAGSDASYPVIRTIGRDSLLLVYDQKTNDRTRVAFQHVSLRQ